MFQKNKYFRAVHSYCSRDLLCECKSLFSIFSTLIVVSVAPHDRVELVPPLPFRVRNFNEIQPLCVFISAGQTNAGQQYGK